MHLNPLQIIYTIILGIIIAIVYLKFDSLWNAILIHFGFNGTSVSLSFIAESNEITMGSLYALTVLIVFLVLFFYSLNNKKESITHG